MKQAYSVLLLLTVFLTGCVRETLDINNLRTICSVSADLPDMAETKAHLSERKVTWDANDVIGVFSDVQGVAYYRNENAADGTAGNRFSGQSVSGTEFYAFYPGDGSIGFNPDDRKILAEHLGISPQQLKYVTRSGEGRGLIFYGSVIVPFVDHFPKNTQMYKVMTTKLSETGEEGVMALPDKTGGAASGTEVGKGIPKKKRGRPSKAEIEARKAREAAASGGGETIPENDPKAGKDGTYGKEDTPSAPARKKRGRPSKKEIEERQAAQKANEEAGSAE